MTLSFSADLPALAGISTPALVIDQVALSGNIARMAETARRRGIALRPHAKTHKSAYVANQQIAAGAAGIACATILEAEALAAAGVSGLLVTSPIVGADKVARLARLNGMRPLTAVVDHPSQVEALAATMPSGDRPLELLVDVDVGQGRTGVANGQDAVALARAIATHPRLAFRGLQGYAGHIQHIIDASQRRAAATRSAEQLRTVAAGLATVGLACPVISGSGTGAHADDADGPYTEWQVGSYVFMDADYGAIRLADGQRLPFAQALFVLATVVSINQPGQITVDAGTKALATNGPAPDCFRGLPDGARYTFGGDEHGIIKLPAGAAPLPLGARVLIGATHCDPTVNLHACYRVVDADGVVTVTPVLGRYGAAT
jgi:D-serine deaminase-like pyridoxal phosphate-dependent protein